MPKKNELIRLSVVRALGRILPPKRIQSSAARFKSHRVGD
jgi:hypothetical protein